MAWLLLAMVFLVGCQQRYSGRLVLKSLSSPDTFLVGGFQTRLYQVDDQNNLTLLLLDGTIEDPIQVVTIRMFWKPRAGRTPIDPTATNATIYYTIFSGQNRSEVGIYAGAGFVYPGGRPGDEEFNASVWHATLRLTDRSTKFDDLLGSAVLEGNLAATRDDATVRRVLKRLGVLISQKMGYPRWVNASPPTAARTDWSSDS